MIKRQHVRGRRIVQVIEMQARHFVIADQTGADLAPRPVGAQVEKGGAGAVDEPAPVGVGQDAGAAAGRQIKLNPDRRLPLDDIDRPASEKLAPVQRSRGFLQSGVDHFARRFGGGVAGRSRPWSTPPRRRRRAPATAGRPSASIF